MPTSSITHELSATPQAGSLSLTAAADCALSAVYTDDQFVPSTPRTLSRNHGSVIPPGVCLRQSICYFPVLRFAATQVAIAVNSPELEFEASETDLSYTGEESFIIAEFDLAATPVSASQQAGVARVMFEILDAPVDHSVVAFRELAFPSLVSDLTFEANSPFPVNYSKKKWLEIDASNQWKSAVTAAGEGSVNSLICGFRVTGDGVISLGKEPILIVRIV